MRIGTKKRGAEIKQKKFVASAENLTKDCWERNRKFGGNKRVKGEPKNQKTRVPKEENLGLATLAERVATSPRTAITDWSNQNKTTDDKKRNTLVVKKVVVVSLHSVPRVLKRTSLVTLEIMIVTQLKYSQKSKTIKKKKIKKGC